MNGPRSWNAGDPPPAGYVIAKDGLPARDQGLWAQDKLRWLEEFLRPAIGATKKKGEATYYVDLFAGPGRNANSDGDDFPGSPLIALEAKYRFRHERRASHIGNFRFCNLQALDHGLLEERVARSLKGLGGAVDSSNALLLHGDSNQLIHKILSEIPAWAYVMVFADIEGPRDLAFETVQALRAKHDSVDLYLLYPTNLGIGRLFAYNQPARDKHRATLDRYYGTDGWWSIVDERTTNAQAREMKVRLLQLYQDQLRTMWEHVSVVLDVQKGASGLYHMLFATNFEPALSMADSARMRAGQYDIFDRLR